MFNICRTVSRAASSASRMALRSNRGVAASLTTKFVPATATQAARRPFHTSLSNYASTTDMSCRQCEQTANSVMCTTIGTCGKTPETAALQDLLVFGLKGLGAWVVAARNCGVTGSVIDKADQLLLVGMFSTLTNVNFDSARIAEYAHETAALRNELEAAVKANGGVAPSTPAADFVPPKGASVAELEAIARGSNLIGIEGTIERIGADRAGVLELITYGLKGVCAYAEHLSVLEEPSESIKIGIAETFAFLASEEHDLDTLLGMALRLGQVNWEVTQALEDAHKAKFGAMEPTHVRTHAKAGKSILVSGHDMRDLRLVLEATAGKNINVYTHGEMLPGNSYPELKKHKHFIGHYGTAWQNQKIDFAAFPGAVLMTTNCIIQPMKSYKSRIFTRSAVGWPGVTHLPEGASLQPLLDAALAAKGFADDEKELPGLTIGYGKDTILSVAGDVVDAVKAGAVKRFFFIGGCDGTETERNYFTDMAKQVPDDGIILTAGCAKFRFNRLLEGKKVGAFPKVLDCGQCNDISGALAVASALAEALKCGVNDLPLEFGVSWLEQKAVAQLLTCLHLGVTGIHLGPNLPAFVTPNVLNVLVSKFNLAPVTTPHKDFPGMLMEQ